MLSVHTRLYIRCKPVSYACKDIVEYVQLLHTCISPACPCIQHAPVREHACMHMCTCAYIHAHAYPRVYVCIHTCTCLYSCVRVHTYMHTPILVCVSERVCFDIHFHPGTYGLYLHTQSWTHPDGNNLISEFSCTYIWRAFS